MHACMSDLFMYNYVGIVNHANTNGLDKGSQLELMIMLIEEVITLIGICHQAQQYPWLSYNP